jgi:serine/threonine protein kinase
MGLCYRDISFGNVFFDPDTGEVLICDNDNVAVDGEGKIGVLGTPRFMAPEIVRGEALPSMHTDVFSLAVLLFYMLIMHHPLEGKRELAIKCLDLPAMNKLYGTDPLFIYDPDDDSGSSTRRSCETYLLKRLRRASTMRKMDACVKVSGVLRWYSSGILSSTVVIAV